MTHSIGEINLVLAWLWIVLGFVAGSALGLGFHREDWLGGYASFRRRLYRLGHISFFGLAIINLLFYFTARTWVATTVWGNIASWGFIVGALGMPACCFVVANRPEFRAAFAVPIASLIVAGVLTLREVITL